MLHQLCEARVPLENLPERPFAALRRGGLHKADAGNSVVESKHPDPAFIEQMMLGGVVSTEWIFGA
jgi:hypothetical protein